MLFLVPPWQLASLCSCVSFVTPAPTVASHRHNIEWSKPFGSGAQSSELRAQIPHDTSGFGTDGIRSLFMGPGCKPRSDQQPPPGMKPCGPHARSRNPQRLLVRQAFMPFWRPRSPAKCKVLTRDMADRAEGHWCFSLGLAMKIYAGLLV